MSAKKLPKSDWYECNVCACLMSARDANKHFRHCNGADAADGEPYGYFKDGILHAVLTDPVEGLDVKLAVTIRSALAFMNPSTMQLAGLSLGDPVVVDGGTACLIAWPVPKMATAAVSLSRDNGTFDVIGKELGSLISLQPLATPFTSALSAHLTIASTQAAQTVSEADSTSFSSYVHNALIGRYIGVGNMLKLRYYGLPLLLKVEALLPSCKSGSIQQPNCDVDCVTYAVDALDLSSASHAPATAEPTTPVTSSSARCCVLSPSPCDDRPTMLAQLCVPRCAYSSLQFYCVTSQTDVKTGSALVGKVDAPEAFLGSSMPHITFDMIGGLNRQLDALKDLIQLPLEQPSLFKTYGLALPKGVLLYGASGTGKTMLAHAIATEVKATFINLNGPEIWSKYFGETESKLNALFKEALDKSPSVIFIDELDALCPRRERSQSETEKRVLATLLLLIDSIEHYPDRRVILLGATNKPDVIDPALRRPGRFDREIELTIPSAAGRLEILTKLLSSALHKLNQNELCQIADSTHGFVGADLVALCQEAGMRAIKRNARCVLAAEGDSNKSICASDFMAALTVVQPSAMREVVADVPKVCWTDIGGQKTLKESLRQAVEWPLKHKAAFRHLGVTAPRGVLMYGPPGCSKTMFAKALANESGLNFIPIKGPELFSKWVGESEKAVREVFRKARAAAPSIVFFDEIDALASERGSSSGGSGVGDRVLAQLLTEMDGVEALQDVVVVAATNRPDMIDKALLRPGRLDRIIYVPLPDAETRRDILNICKQKIPVPDDFDIELLVERTAGYSGAEVTAVCNEAGLAAMTECIEAKYVEMRHFLAALDVVRPRTSPAAIQLYDAYARSAAP